jgi:hypothetical protein
MLHREAFTDRLCELRWTFHLCHDIQGNQIGWPDPGSMSDQYADIVFSFALLRGMYARKMKSAIDQMRNKQRNPREGMTRHG